MPAADVTPRTQPRRVSDSMARAPRRQSDPKKRVVITGMGVVSVFGNDTGAFYDRLLAGRAARGTSTASTPPGAPPASPPRSAASPPRATSTAKSDRRLDDCQRYALVAARKALESADLALGSIAMAKVGTVAELTTPGSHLQLTNYCDDPHAD